MSAMPPPKFGTPRNPARATRGPNVAVLSRLLGQPFMPYQRYVASVATELDPDGPPGAPWYRDVFFTGPRQIGKTTLVRGVALDRTMAISRAEVCFTAQTGKDARKKWNEWADAIEESPLDPFFKIKRGAGAESMRLKGNRSEFSPFAPTKKGLHSRTPALVLSDELWAHDEEAGVALEAGITPAQITLPWRQRWWLSTRGDAASTWWHNKLAEARDLAQRPGSRVALFDFSADEELAERDPYSPEVLAFHPAVGRREDGYIQTIADLLETAAGETPGNWRRGYLNLETATVETVISVRAWEDLDLEHPAPPLVDCVIGFAVAHDRSGSAVWAAHMHLGAPCLHLVTHQSGSGWLPNVLQDLRARGAHELVARDAGHTAAVIKTLTTAGIPVTAVPAHDYATAWSTFEGRVTDETIHHDGSTELADNLKVLKLRRVAGGRAPDDEKSVGPIDHLNAGMLAAYRAEHLPTRIPIY